MANVWNGPALKKAEAAKKKAWTSFLNRFPKADKSRFISQATVDEKNNVTAEVFFKESEDSFQSVFGSDRKYWTAEMKKALGLGDSGFFPYQLAPLGSKEPLPIPAIPFEEKVESLKEIFNAPIKIYVTPSEYFTTKFRKIFTRTKLRHTSTEEGKHWQAGPDMKYWPQQLNFSVFCATQGCGVSREIFDSGIDLPPQIRAFYKFHVYFTVRRILYQLGGIQSISALPGDAPFSQYKNHYDRASYNRICREFGIDPSSDFRFTHGVNHGLGSIYVYGSGTGLTKTDYKFPGWLKFSNEGGKAINGDLMIYIESGAGDAQADWFALNTANGLTQAGLSRINQSIEAFVYCVLGAQVNIRSSILGSGGRAREAQTDFLVLMEDAIRQPDLAASVQRYQLAVDQAKVRLNLAVAPMACLMPAQMIINTASTIGYNNKLKQAVSGMKLGMNNGVNPETKKAVSNAWQAARQKLTRPVATRPTRFTKPQQPNRGVWLHPTGNQLRPKLSKRSHRRKKLSPRLQTKHRNTKLTKRR